MDLASNEKPSGATVSDQYLNIGDVNDFLMMLRLIMLGLKRKGAPACNVNEAHIVW